MALIKCPECGKMISDKAEYCVGCGLPIRKTNDKKELIRSISPKWIIVGAIAFVLVVALFISEKDKSIQKRYSDYYRTEPSYAIEPKTGKEGAQAKAESYLHSQAFSYDGLVHQLEFEGFSKVEAEYAADHCGADWNEQAIRKAESYLHSQSFSYDGLIHQLGVEGFTDAESKYGVDHCGADWKEQAVKKATSYMRISDYSRYELVHLLEVEGFTHEQAVYGVDKNMY